MPSVEQVKRLLHPACRLATLSPSFVTRRRRSRAGTNIPICGASSSAR